MDNILLSHDNIPYLMDFGSVSESRKIIKNRRDACVMMEWAQSNMEPFFYSTTNDFKPTDLIFKGFNELKCS